MVGGKSDGIEVARLHRQRQSCEPDRLVIRPLGHAGVQPAACVFKPTRPDRQITQAEPHSIVVRIGSFEGFPDIIDGNGASSSSWRRFSTPDGSLAPGHASRIRSRASWILPSIRKRTSIC